MAPVLDFKTVLDQYNRQLEYFRSTMQKVIAAIAGYAALHAGSQAVALTEHTYAVLFLIAHFTIAAYVGVIGNASFLRMLRSHRAVVELLGPQPEADLRRLGILRREPLLVALAWGSLYLAVHGTFLVIVHFAHWK